MSNERPNDFAIDEFKALRDEVKRCESESLSVTLYAFTAVVLAVGVAEKSGLPKWAIPILIQVALLWTMHRYYALIMLGLRLSTYIQVMLEPVLPGLRWEGRNESFEKDYDKIRYFKCERFNRYLPGFSRVFNRTLHRFSQVFVPLCLIGIIVSFNVLRQIQPHDYRFYGLIGVLLMLHLMSSLLVYKCVFRRHTPASFIKIWQSIK